MFENFTEKVDEIIKNALNKDDSHEFKPVLSVSFTIIVTASF